MISRKLVVLFIFAFLTLQGCSLNCHQVMGHDSVWKSPGHVYFSLIGYKNPSVRDVEASTSEGWWGCPVDIGGCKCSAVCEN
jgi:hypothetical protein